MQLVRSFLLLCCLLSGCIGQVISPTASPEPRPANIFTTNPTTDIKAIPSALSLSPTQTQTKQPTQTLTRWPTLTPSLTPSQTLTRQPTTTPVPSPTYIKTYPLKEVWIEYGLGRSFSSYFEAVDPIYNFPIATFIIYSDNQILISHPGSPILQKKLSNAEVCGILNELDSLGLYEINSPGYNADDPIYLGKGKEDWPYDAPFYSLTVNGENVKRFSVYEPMKEFVIQPVKDIMNFLEQVQPSGMAPYQPDRLAVAVMGGRDFFENPEELVAAPWPEHLIALKEAVNGGFYLEGKDAARVYKLLNGADGKLFEDQGMEYSVFIRPILPHEARQRTEQEAIALSTPPFKCK